MALTVQRFPVTLSASDAPQGLITGTLVESPASEVPIIHCPLEVASSSSTTSQFYDQYFNDLEDHREIFNRNMKNKPVKHDRVYVLMWTWGDTIDDLGVKEEVYIVPTCPLFVYDLTCSV